MKDVTRRQFLKISSGAMGAVVATEAAGLGADRSAVKTQAQQVPLTSSPA